MERSRAGCLIERDGGMLIIEGLNWVERILDERLRLWKLTTAEMPRFELSYLRIRYVISFRVFHLESFELASYRA